jgi:hypothetical protein
MTPSSITIPITDQLTSMWRSTHRSLTDSKSNSNEIITRIRKRIYLFSAHGSFFQFKSRSRAPIDLSNVVVKFCTIKSVLIYYQRSSSLAPFAIHLFIV